MTETIIKIRQLVASDGMILTNGESFSDVGGKILLSCIDKKENWYEITKEEYDNIQSKLINMEDIENGI